MESKKESAEDLSEEYKYAVEQNGTVESKTIAI